MPSLVPQEQETSDTERDPGSHVVSFEEIRLTLISATQDVFRDYMSVELLAGHVDEEMPPVNGTSSPSWGSAGAAWDTS